MPGWRPDVGQQGIDRSRAGWVARRVGTSRRGDHRASLALRGYPRRGREGAEVERTRAKALRSLALRSSWRAMFPHTRSHSA